MNIIAYSVHGFDAMQNQCGYYSNVNVRPETVIELNGALVLKGYATDKAKDLERSSKWLTNKFHPLAFLNFPAGSSRVIGITSAVGAVRIYLIDHRGNGQYSSSMYSQYAVNILPERVRFLVDIFKLMRWIACVTTTTKAFHLTPGIRLKTNNGHHITWIREGILKEFDHNRDFRQQLVYLDNKYQPRPLHIEYGHVNSDRSIIITRIGHRLSSMDMARFNLTRENVLSQVRQGLDELHAIGFAHCDLSIKNVFIDDAGVVFLDDMEYVTPVDSPPPHKTRLPYGTVESSVTTSSMLDELQYQKFCVAALHHL